MPRKPVPLPTPEEARAGLPAASASARLHLDVAELLATAGHYGPACSHLILAPEESVKAKALGWIWQEQHLAPSDEDAIRARLSNHPSRHHVGDREPWFWVLGSGALLMMPIDQPSRRSCRPNDATAEEIELGASEHLDRKS